MIAADDLRELLFENHLHTHTECATCVNTHVLEQVYACKTDVFELLRTRMDAVHARLSGVKGG